MKPFTIFAAVASASAAATPSAPQPARNFDQVSLREPLDWIPGSRIFPYLPVARISRDEHFNRDSWAALNLNECKKHERCTSTLSFSATLIDGTRGWIGFLFTGGSTTENDYVRADPERRNDVQDTVAYTVVNTTGHDPADEGFMSI